MAFGFGFGLPRGAAAPFSPASLFSTGEQGAWYDPSNFVAGWRTNLLTYSQQFGNAAWSKQANAYIQTNLLTYSEQFDNAAWLTSNITVTTNSTVAPDGTNTADLCTPTASGYILRTFASSASTTYTTSVYAKASNTVNIIGIGGYAGPDSAIVQFNIITGTAGTPSNSGTGIVVSSSITPVGNNWYRCVVTFTGIASVNLPFSPIYNAAQSGGLYLWGAQLVQGSDAGNYQVTTSATAATQYPAPDGTNTANLAIFTSTSNNAIYQGSNTYAYETRTSSVYLKGTAGQTISVSWQAGNSTFTAWTLTGGWDRVTATATNGATAGNGNIAVQPLAGQTATSVYVWGAQLEVGSSATAYQQIVTPEISYLNYQAQPVMYQDAAGTTPVTAVEQPVGLLLDQRQGPTLGSELISNGNFANGSTGWTAGANWSIGSGAATATASITVLSQAGVFTSGNWYKISFIQTTTSGNVQIRIAGTQSVGYVGTSGTSNVPTTLYVYATASGALEFNAQTFTGSITNISVKTISGNHATASGTARPTLSAKYNLLTYTEDFTNAIWLKTFGGTGTAPTVTSGYTDPNGGSTAFRVQLSCGAGTTSGDYSRLYQVITVTNATAGIWMKSNTASNYQIEYDLSSAASVKTVTPTWQYFSNAANNAAGDVSVILRGSTAGGATSADISVWHPDVRVTNDGVNLPNYQRVNASTDYATAGFPLYLSFSGAQGMSTPASIPFATVTSDGKATRNLLTYPAQIGNTGGWAVNAVTATVNNITAPDGTNTGTAVSAASAANGYVITVAQSPTATTTYTFSVYAKGVTGGEIIKLYADGGFNGSVGPAITLTTTWTRYTYTVTASTSATGYCYLLSGTTYGGTGQAFYCWGAQLEVGSTATAFQNIGTDQMTVWAGERKLSDAAAAIVAELSVDTNLNSGTFAVTAPNNNGIANLNFGSKGTTLVANIITTYTAPLTNVITGIASISTPVVTIRVNGTQAATSSSTQGTGNYGTYPLFIGARNLTSVFFNGRIYSLIVRGATSNASQISSTEGWVNIKTAAY